LYPDAHVGSLPSTAVNWLANLKFRCCGAHRLPGGDESSVRPKI
jgi:hypothetical protein